MQLSSEYPGPSRDDYANVLALNHAFMGATSDLKGPQRGRLATAPFLLFSVREHDLDWWGRALTERHHNDLIDALTSPIPALARLQTAAMSFLWQLAGRNPYAVRIISGATIAWCEKITDLPLVTLLDRIDGRGDLLMSRLESSDSLSARLLHSGTSSRHKVQRSSQVTALQGLLTRSGLDDYSRLPAAACSMSGPMRVLDKKV